MVDIETLLPELQSIVGSLSEDMLKRVSKTSALSEGLEDAHKRIAKGGRTGQTFRSWLGDYLEQVSVAWVLSCVFVRFMEDNHLIDECWLAGEGDRRKLAEDTHELYFREHPRESDREYFEHVFYEIGKFPACADLFAKGKTPLWAVGPSGDGAMALLEFLRDIDSESGHLKRSFQTDGGDTRFLGDLYEELSLSAQKKYALKQTPVFVEEFILDRTLTPAIGEFGLEEVRVIDPTCGSGHFLLGAFNRLFDDWIKRGDNEIVAAQNAFDGVWGVDINPFAVAIARFRLTVAALHVCELNRLKSAPSWDIHLATGDSLLFGSRFTKEGQKVSEQQFFQTDDESWAPEIYACEDKEALSQVLGQQYHAVVGNPPYITVKDKMLNKGYRNRFPQSCHRQYSLGVPFTERFFDLAMSGQDGKSGYVGMITANSFMKREFGTKIIGHFFSQVELTHVIDSAGAYIPGHGTPTVIMFGRNRKATTNTVRGVLGIRGEPETPQVPANGKVWQSILTQIDVANSQDQFISTEDVPRSVFNKHPWSLTGGGARETKDKIEQQCERSLSDVTEVVGYICMTRADDIYVTDCDVLRRRGIGESNRMPLVDGNVVRDWELSGLETALFPYDDQLEPVGEDESPSVIRYLWPYRSHLWLRQEPNGDHKKLGLTWFEWSRFQKNRFLQKEAICYPEIASHNHFVMDQGDKVFNRSAPIIKLSKDKSEGDYMRLLAYMNSSVVCFWMKEVSHQKQMTGGDGVRIESRARVPYQFACTAMKRMPIPDAVATGTGLGTVLEQLARKMDEHAKAISTLSPEALLEDWLITGGSVEAAWDALEAKRLQHRSAMIFLQEEIDFVTYVLFGFVSEDLLCPDIYKVIDQCKCDAGLRPFEFYCGNNEDGASVPSSVPDEWPEHVRQLWNDRMSIIGESKALTLLEDAHYKRRWIGKQGLFNLSARQDEVHVAARKLLLNELELLIKNETTPNLCSVSWLADKASNSEKIRRLGSVFRGREDFDISKVVKELVEGESVPGLPVLVYKAKASHKREAWQDSWALQRREDAEGIELEITPPPQFASTDFQKGNYDRLRGRFDVPKERFVSFPYCDRDGDPSLVVGWAGWNHVEQATAIVAYYDARKREGWTAERLTPLLAGLDELLPWIHQWHPEIDSEYNETAGTSFQTLLESEAQELGLTLEQIRSWTPPAGKGGRKKAEGGKQPRKTQKTRKKKSEAEG